MDTARVHQINTVVAQLPPSGIRAFFDLVLGMEDVISLGVGEPDFVTPWRVREQAIFAIEKGYTSYTSNKGLRELRAQIAAFVERQYGVGYDIEDEILVTVGVSEAMDLAMRAILNPGDEVIIHDPCYVSYAPTVTLAGGVPVLIDTWAAPGFKVTPAMLRAAITPRTRAVLLNYPANPTGASYTRAELAALAAVLIEHDLLLLSDEIYDALSYEAAHVAMPSLPGMRDRTIYFNGFSKGHAMTGFRLGYVCGPAPLVAAMTKIHQYTILCAPIVSQMAAIEALRHGMPDVFDMVGEYNQRRRFIVHALNEAGLDCHMPHGAFYVLPSVRRTGMDGMTFATQLLQEQRVAVVPGTAFGAAGTQHVRIAYAASLAKLKEAMARIACFIRDHT
jgi:aminotransferase